MLKKEFWKKKTLEEMNEEEWEALCDNCAKCCLIKLQDEDDDQIYYTNVVCDLLDKKTCKCTKYKARCKLVPTCLKLDKDNIHLIEWMPKTCAYRLIRDGQDLPDWHPLVGKDKVTNYKIGEKSVFEKDIDEEDIEDYLVDWDDV
jgi:uncharacterized cysteine cluster protein YcgN (CxxCxxCC family)